MKQSRKALCRLGREISASPEYPEKADLSSQPDDENRRLSDRLLPRLPWNRSSEIASLFSCLLCVVSLIRVFWAALNASDLWADPIGMVGPVLPLLLPRGFGLVRGHSVPQAPLGRCSGGRCP